MNVRVPPHPFSPQPLSKSGLSVRGRVLYLALVRWSIMGVALLSCGDQLKGLAEDPKPLTSIYVQLEGSLEGLVDEESRSRLRVGVLWAGINLPEPWCLQFLSDLIGENESDDEDGDQSREDPELDIEPNLDELNAEALQIALSTCRDPFGVAPALPGPSVALPDDLTQPIEIPIYHLPTAEVMIGTPDARVAYATLLLFEDTAEDRRLTLGETQTTRDLSKSRRRGDDDAPSPEERAPEIDRVYGASFVSLLEEQVRLVFREGDFVSTFFYPAPDCEAPPIGFSVQRVSGAFQPTCELSSIEEPISLKIQAPSDRLQELLCQSTPDNYERFPDDPPLDSVQLTCISPIEVLATLPDSDCKTLEVWTLKECGDGEEGGCDLPEWDYTASPPDWWPCGVDP
jgi:hypothetical protein